MGARRRGRGNREVSQSYLDDRVIVHAGDCMDILKTLPENSVDSVVTDPPYGIGFMGKEWDSGKAFIERKPLKSTTFDFVGGNHHPTSSADVSRTRLSEGRKFGAWCELWAREVIRVLKPGGHLFAFGGTRTYHRLVYAIEDAGFEIRDQYIWAFGSGFPKSLDVGKAIDRAAGAERNVIGKTTKSIASMLPGEGNFSDDNYKWQAEFNQTAPATDAARQWDGWGTAAKPAFENICLARKPLSEKTVAANILRWGTGGLNINACRIPKAADDRHEYGVSGDKQSLPGCGVTGNMRQRVAYEPSDLGRYPANLIHDSSDEVMACFPESKTEGHFPNAQRRHNASSFSVANGNIAPERRLCDSGSAARFFASFPQENDGLQRHASKSGSTIYGSDKGGQPKVSHKDSGSSARFFASFPQEVKRLFYCAKAGPDDRLGFKHPTVKPLKLLQYLCRLITPPGGTLLDCFAGTGTTAEAAYREGFKAILIEREAEYLADINRRMNLVKASKAERKQASAKARAKPVDAGPLFDSAVTKLFEPETLAGLAQLAIDTGSDIKVKIIK